MWFEPKIFDKNIRNIKNTKNKSCKNKKNKNFNDAIIKIVFLINK